MVVRFQSRGGSEVDLGAGPAGEVDADEGVEDRGDLAAVGLGQPFAEGGDLPLAGAHGLVEGGHPLEEVPPAGTRGCVHPAIAGRRTPFRCASICSRGGARKRGR